MHTRILYTLFICCSCHILTAQNVNIPDAFFKQALIDAGVDTNDDGAISEAEAEAVTNLEVSQEGIADLTGIKDFINLVMIQISLNRVTSLDVSGLNNLKVILAGSNDITSLNVTGCTNLRIIDVERNELTDLELTDLPELVSVIASRNNLENLELDNLPELEVLFLSTNSLSSLDLCDLPNLNRLEVLGNSNLYCVKVDEGLVLDPRDRDPHTSLVTDFTDSDGDGVCDEGDNCPRLPNPDQVPVMRVARCKGEIDVVLDSDGIAEITFADIDDGSIYCSLDDVSVEPTSFSCVNIGENTVQMSIGESSSCSITVHVRDETLPEAQCKSEVTLMLAENGELEVVAADIDEGSSDNCGLFLYEVMPKDFDCDDVGEHSITLKVTDASENVATCVSSVEIVDGTKPRARCKDISVALDESEIRITSEDIDDGSLDNCGVVGTMLSKSSFNCDDVGENEVQLQVIDAANLVSTCKSTVTIVDNTNPTITSPSSVDVVLDKNGQGHLTLTDIASANDNCGIASLTMAKTTTTARSILDGSHTLTFNCSEVGANIVTICATDVNGNISTQPITVNVIDDQKPRLVNLPPREVELALGDEMPEPADVQVIDNCADRVKFIILPRGAGCGEVFEYRWTTEDAGGNTASFHPGSKIQGSQSARSECAARYLR